MDCFNLQNKSHLKSLKEAPMIKLFIVFSAFFISSTWAMYDSQNQLSLQEQEPQALWQQRPTEVQEKIDVAYNSLASQKNDSSNCTLFDGYSKEYLIAGIKDYSLLKYIISTAPPTQKEFNFLDVGPKNFEWSIEVFKLLQGERLPYQKIDAEPYNLPIDIIVNIYSIRSEKGGKALLGHHNSNVRLFNWGEKRIENISEIFPNNFFDFIITKSGLTNCVDPLGTFMQFYDILKPQGFFLFEGIFVFDKDNDEGCTNKNIRRILRGINAPFLYKHYNLNRSGDHYVAKKTTDKPLNLPVSYHGIQNSGMGNPSSVITLFDLSRLPEDPRVELTQHIEQKEKRKFNEIIKLCHQGSRALFNELRQNMLDPLEAGFGLDFLREIEQKKND